MRLCYNITTQKAKPTEKKQKRQNPNKLYMNVPIQSFWAPSCGGKCARVSLWLWMGSEF